MKFEVIAGLCCLMVVGSAVTITSSKSNTSSPSHGKLVVPTKDITRKDRFPDVELNLHVPDVVAVPVAE